jgi:putative membrane protein
MILAADLVAQAAHPLVHLNAALNGLATVLLITGYVLIKRRRPHAHGRVMLTAFGVSCMFLVSYLIYHFIILEGGSVKFTHPGTVRYVYLTILLTHIVLAAIVPFLAMATIYYALRGTGMWKSDMSLGGMSQMLVKHRRLARWTFPIWIYVSITGVVVYVMLYHLWPPTSF